MLSSGDSFKQKETLFFKFSSELYLHFMVLYNIYITASFFPQTEKMHFLLRESYIKINCPHLMY